MAVGSCVIQKTSHIMIKRSNSPKAVRIKTETNSEPSRPRKDLPTWCSQLPTRYTKCSNVFELKTMETQIFSKEFLGADAYLPPTFVYQRE